MRRTIWREQQEQVVEEKFDPNYESHLGMICNILGVQAMMEGEGVFPFLKAVETYDPNRKVKFSTWLYHNLQLAKLKQCRKRKGPPEGLMVDINEVSNIDGVPNPASIVEFMDTISNLSQDAQTIVEFILRPRQVPKKRKKWSTETTGTKTQVKADIKEYCRGELKWSWPRYYQAITEIKDCLKS